MPPKKIIRCTSSSSPPTKAKTTKQVVVPAAAGGRKESSKGTAVAGNFNSASSWMKNSTGGRNKNGGNHEINEEERMNHQEDRDRGGSPQLTWSRQEEEEEVENAQRKISEEKHYHQQAEQQHSVTSQQHDHDEEDLQVIELQQNSGAADALVNHSTMMKAQKEEGHHRDPFSADTSFSPNKKAVTGGSSSSATSSPASSTKVTPRPKGSSFNASNHHTATGSGGSMIASRRFERIEAQLNSGPNALPPAVSSDLSRIAQRLTQDDVLVSRLGWIVQEESERGKEMRKHQQVSSSSTTTFSTADSSSTTFSSAGSSHVHAAATFFLQEEQVHDHPLPSEQQIETTVQECENEKLRGENSKDTKRGNVTPPTQVRNRNKTSATVVAADDKDSTGQKGELTSVEFFHTPPTSSRQVPTSDLDVVHVPKSNELMANSLMMMETSAIKNADEEASIGQHQTNKSNKAPRPVAQTPRVQSSFNATFSSSSSSGGFSFPSSTARILPFSSSRSFLVTSTSATAKGGSGSAVEGHLKLGGLQRRCPEDDFFVSMMAQTSHKNAADDHGNFHFSSESQKNSAHQYHDSFKSPTSSWDAAAPEKNKAATDNRNEGNQTTFDFLSSKSQDLPTNKTAVVVNQPETRKSLLPTSISPSPQRPVVMLSVEPLQQHQGTTTRKISRGSQSEQREGNDISTMSIGSATSSSWNSMNGSSLLGNDEATQLCHPSHNNSLPAHQWQQPAQHAGSPTATSCYTASTVDDLEDLYDREEFEKIFSLPFTRIPSLGSNSTLNNEGATPQKTQQQVRPRGSLHTSPIQKSPYRIESLSRRPGGIGVIPPLLYGQEGQEEGDENQENKEEILNQRGGLVQRRNIHSSSYLPLFLIPSFLSDSIATAVSNIWSSVTSLLGIGGTQKEDRQGKRPAEAPQGTWRVATTWSPSPSVDSSPHSSSWKVKRRSYHHNDDDDDDARQKFLFAAAMLLNAGILWAIYNKVKIQVVLDKIVETVQFAFWTRGA